jgi:hypothetical protein
MGGDIALIAVGGLASLAAAFLEGAQPPDWLTLRRLESGSFLFEALTISGFLFPVYGVTDLTEGRSVWIRLIWIVVAFVGGASLYGVPARFRHRRQAGHEAAVLVGDPVVRQPVRKWRT